MVRTMWLEDIKKEDLYREAMRHLLLETKATAADVDFLNFTKEVAGVMRESMKKIQGLGEGEVNGKRWDKIMRNTFMKINGLGIRYVVTSSAAKKKGYNEDIMEHKYHENYDRFFRDRQIQNLRTLEEWKTNGNALIDFYEKMILDPDYVYKG